MSEHYLLFLDDLAWRMARVQESHVLVSSIPRSHEATLEDCVQTLKQHLAQTGYAHQPILVVLPSSWCLCATISTAKLDRGGRRRALGFRLEDHLPISAEEFVADFVDTGADETLSVAAELERLGNVVHALETAGIPIRHICPAALLAAAYAVDAHSEVTAVLLATAHAPADVSSPPRPIWDLVELRKGVPANWWWLAEDADALRRCLAAWTASTEPPRRLAVIGPDSSRLRDILPPDVEPLFMNDVDPDQAAALQGAKLLETAASPWIDLRRDSLAAPDRFHVYYKPFAALLAASALLLLCLSGMMIWRALQYSSLAANYALSQQQVFKETFPDQHLPVSGNIRGRLLSEGEKLAGLTGLTSSASSIPEMQSASALVHLRELLHGLPSDVHFRILEFSIQPDRLRIDGECPSHSDADHVAASLRQSGIYDVELPRQQALRDGGVSFLFVATPRQTPATAKGER